MMVTENLPRVADEERNALDGGYVAMEGVPTGDISVDDLIAQRIDALKAMRVAAGDLEAFSVASRQEAELAAQIRRMRRQAVASGTPKPAKAVAVVVVLALLAGCSLTPTQTKWAGFAAGVLIVGAIAAHETDSGKPTAPPNIRTPTVPCSNPETCR